MRFRLHATLVTSILVSACGGSDSGTTPPRVVTRVAVTSSTTTINQGQTLQLSAAAFDGSGVQIANPGTFTWSSSVTSIATVDQTGKVAGTGAGTAAITAELSGVKGTLNVKVNLSGAASKDTIFTIGMASFSPNSLPIALGSTVIFALGFDGIGHDVRFGAIPGAPEYIPVTVRGYVARTFTVAGDFSYVCPTHPQMTGVVVVR